MVERAPPINERECEERLKPLAEAHLLGPSARDNILKLEGAIRHESRLTRHITIMWQYQLIRHCGMFEDSRNAAYGKSFSGYFASREEKLVVGQAIRFVVKGDTKEKDSVSWFLKNEEHITYGTSPTTSRRVRCPIYVQSHYLSVNTTPNAYLPVIPGQVLRDLNSPVSSVAADEAFTAYGVRQGKAV